MSISTKDKIIDISIDLFSKNGYPETSIRDIAREAKIKTSSIYYYFESKEAILDYILDDYIKIVSESRHRRRWHAEKDSIIADKSKISAKEIMNLLFSRFEEQNFVRYRKMVKIICSETVRNSDVREYFRYQNNDSFEYIKSVLDYLLDAGKILKCDTVKMASLLCSLSFAFMHLDSIDIQNISKDDENTNVFSLMEYVLKTVEVDTDE